MRDILFRGKNITTGEWEVGDLVYFYRKVPYIHKSYGDAEIYREIDPDTVGQYTEQKDVKGNKIFEGDILMRDNDCDDLLCIWWNDETSAFCAVDDSCMYEADFIQRLELIGNRYDSPELLDIRNPKDDDEE